MQESKSKKNYIKDTSNKGTATSKVLAKKEQQLASLVEV